MGKKYEQRRKNKTWWIFPLIAVLVLGGISGFIGWNLQKNIEPDLTSVIVGGEYHATSTAKMSGVLAKAAEFNQLIKTAEYSSVTLGSIIVASTTAHAMNIYNATSTDALVNGDATFITRLSSSTPRGTYTYDIALDDGLVVQLQAGYTGDYVVTYR